MPPTSTEKPPDTVFIVLIVLIGVLYAIAGLILILAPWGILSGPGIVVAVSGIYCCATKRMTWAAALAIASAAMSFGAQAITVICAACTASATCFGFAGLLSMICGYQKPLTVVALSAVLCGSLTAYSNSGYIDSRIAAGALGYTAISTSAPGNGGGNKTSDEGGEKEIALMYVSPGCASCQEVITSVISADPEGKNWAPVIIPRSSYNQGCAWLEMAGYRGKVLAEEKSPNHAVPLLVFEYQQYTGVQAIQNSWIYKNIGAGRSDRER